MGLVGQEPGRVGLQLLDEHALGGDLAEHLTVGRARHGDGDRQGGTVAGQAHHPHVVAEVLAAELGTDAELPGQLEHLLLQLGVAEAVAGGGIPGLRELVEVLGARVLGCLEGELGAGAADDDGQVVRGAGSGAEAAQLLVEEAHHRVGVEHGLGLLEQEGLVGAATTLGHEEELVGALVPGGGVGVELDLGRQVGAGVALVPRRDRGHLGVAQVQPGVGVVDPTAHGFLVAPGRQHVLTALAHDDRCPGVLAHGQDAARGDVRVLEQVERDELVVVARLRVIEDVRQLLEVRRAQVVRDVVHGGVGEQAQGLGLDLEERAPARPVDDRHAVGGEQPVGGLVVPDGQ